MKQKGYMFAICLDKIQEYDYPASIKLLAMTLKENPYLAPAQFFKGLSDSDFAALHAMVESYADDQDHDGKDARTIMLLTILLSNAEGILPDNEDCEVMRELFNTTVVFVITEKLHRLGLVEADYSGFTYDLESDQVIARK